MELIGKEVRHLSFGSGVITEKRGHIISVRFGTDERSFVFPDAFGKFLSMKEAKDRKAVSSLLLEIESKRASEREKTEKENEFTRRCASLVPSRASQAIIICGRESARKAVSELRAPALRTDGEPLRAIRNKLNSACLIAFRRASKLYAAGVFMTDADYRPAGESDGTIKGDANFRVAFGEGGEPEIAFEGIGKRQKLVYIGNEEMLSLLISLPRFCDGEEDDFIAHFCNVNRLSDPKSERSRENFLRGEEL